MSLRAMGAKSRQQLHLHDRLCVLPENFDGKIEQLKESKLAASGVDWAGKVRTNEVFIVMKLVNSHNKKTNYALLPLSQAEPSLEIQAVATQNSESKQEVSSQISDQLQEHKQAHAKFLVTKKDLEEQGIPLPVFSQSNNDMWNGVAFSGIGVAEFAWMALDLNMEGIVGGASHSLMTEVLGSNLINYSALDVGFNLAIPLIAFVGLLAWNKFKEGEINPQALILSGQLFGKMAGAVLGWQLVHNLIAELSYHLVLQAGLIGLGTAVGVTVLNFVTTLIGDYLNARREAQSLPEDEQSAYINEKMSASFKSFFSEDTGRLALAAVLAGAVWFLMAAATTALTAGVPVGLAIAIYLVGAVVTGVINASIFKYVAQPVSSEAAKLTKEAKGSSSGFFSSRPNSDQDADGDSNEVASLLPTEDTVAAADDRWMIEMIPTGQQASASP
ncbi:MAG: hypothetical protein GKR77_07185 [Legionellales bacterium]|nr:hypothetical protein [Legionellales bacterium]